MELGCTQQHWTLPWVTCPCSQMSEVSTRPFRRLILYTWNRKRETPRSDFPSLAPIKSKTNFPSGGLTPFFCSGGGPGRRRQRCCLKAKSPRITALEAKCSHYLLGQTVQAASTRRSLCHQSGLWGLLPAATARATLAALLAPKQGWPWSSPPPCHHSWSGDLPDCAGKPRSTW